MIKSVLSVLTVGMLATPAMSEDRVIYGQDNRKDIFEVTDPMHLELAKSTAMLVTLSQFKINDSVLSLPGSTFGVSNRLCQTEPYYDQQAPGFCSGFLVGDDLFVTAGHCISSQRRCDTTAIVFDYNATEDGLSPTSIPVENVYTCKEVVSVSQSGGLDYAVVKLNRPVTGRKPLKIRRSGNVAVGTDLVMIGHPVGLPSKVEDGGFVRSNFSADYFMATTDSYHGNSGSAVFNAETGEVEGILVNGDEDFVRSGGCNVSNVCNETGCRGEGVSKASQFARFVPPLLTP